MAEGSIYMPSYRVRLAKFMIRQQSSRSHGSQLPYLTKVINTLTGLLSLRMYFCASGIRTIQSTLRQLRIYFIVRIHTTIFYHKFSELLGHFNMISCSYDETNWSQK